MSASCDLTTVEKAKLDIGDAGADETLLASLIDAASEMIENHTGRRFAQAAVTEYHDGRGEAFVLLDRPPVDTGETLQVWDDPGRNYGAGSLVDAEGYTVDAEGGVVRLDSGSFANGNRNVKVSYTGGYATVPPAAEQAANILVAVMYARGARRLEMPPLVRALLAPYRRPRL
jgi:uncharacterized phiE125 gp8 family phage protein